MMNKTDLEIISHNIGKSKISLVQIINYLHTEKIMAALIQEVSNDDDIADEIRSAAKHKQYTIHYPKPDSLPGVAIILHNSLHIRQIFKDSSLEILAVRVGTSDKQNAHTMLVSARCPDGVDDLPEKTERDNIQKKIQLVTKTYDKLLELVTTFKHDNFISRNPPPD